MKEFVLVNSGLEKTAVKEIEELIGVKGKLGSGVVEFEAEKEDLLFLCQHGQSFRSVLVGLDKVSDLDNLNLSKVKWKDFFWQNAKFKIEVEGVKGNENRLEISKKVAKEIFSQTEGLGLKLDYKKPDVLIKVYFDSKNYFFGVDICGFDLAKRGYRIFVNPASLKGDLAYYLVRKSGFVKGEKLVIGFIKDGVLAIEAELFNMGKIVNKVKSKLPLFSEVKTKKTIIAKKGRVYGFDESTMNITAAKKNAKLAGIEDSEIRKHDLDELDVKFSEGEIDRLIFYVTRKDEGRINELYYQAKYVLKKKGSLLLVSRKNWEVSISSDFKLISEEEIKRGDCILKIWLLEKK